MAILDFSVSGLCRWHGFRSVSQVCFGISISNFICILMVVIGRSLLIFSDVIFKMAAWWPYWIFWFPDYNFSLALNINSKLKWHNTYWPAHRAGLLWSNFFGQPGSVSKFPPFLCVKLWVGWVGRGYIEISRYFPALWINRVTLVTKIKLWYSLGY